MTFGPAGYLIKTLLKKNLCEENKSEGKKSVTKLRQERGNNGEYIKAGVMNGNECRVGKLKRTNSKRYEYDRDGW